MPSRLAFLFQCSSRAPMRDPYAILGVPRNSDDRTIKSAFHSLLKKHHPDVNIGDPTAADRFREITGAYDILRNPHQRRIHDGHVALIERKRIHRFDIGLIISLASGFFTLAASTVLLSFVPYGGYWANDRALKSPPVRVVTETATQGDPRPSHRDQSTSLDASVLRQWTPRGGLLAPSEPPDTTARATGPAKSTIETSGLQSQAPPSPPEPIQTPSLRTPSSQGASLIAVAPATSTTPTAAVKTLFKTVWDTYRNATTGLRLKYPSNILAKYSSRNDANGGLYGSADGKAVLRILTTANPFSLTVEGIRELIASTRYAGAEFDNRVDSPHAIVLSGRLGGEFFHDVTIMSCDGQSMHGWHLVFPSQDLELFAPLIEVMSQSFLTDRPDGFRCLNSTANTGALRNAGGRASE